MMAFDELLPSVCDATRKCVERKYHKHIFPFLSDVAMQTARAAFDSVFLRSDITSPRIGSLTQLECWQSLWPNILPSSPFLLLREAQTCIFTCILLSRKKWISKYFLSTLFCFHVGVARASQKHDCVLRSAANKETQVWSPANPRPAAAASLFPPLRGVIIALQIFAIAHHYSSQRTFGTITERAPAMALGKCPEIIGMDTESRNILLSKGCVVNMLLDV